MVSTGTFLSQKKHWLQDIIFEQNVLSIMLRVRKMLALMMCWVYGVFRITYCETKVSCIMNFWWQLFCSEHEDALCFCNVPICEGYTVSKVVSKVLSQLWHCPQTQCSTFPLRVNSSVVNESCASGYTTSLAFYRHSEGIHGMCMGGEVDVHEKGGSSYVETSPFSF